MSDTAPGLGHCPTEGAGDGVSGRSTAAPQGVIPTCRVGPVVSATELFPAPSWSASYLRDSGTAPLPCQDHDPELFFAESPRDVDAAKALCAGCPVRALCLAGARERAEPWGVWGGELFKDGHVIARKRARGRPRKHAA